QARLRGVAIVDGALRGEKLQPGEIELRKISQRGVAGETLGRLFPGLAGIQLTTEGSGPNLSLRISKKEGIPIQLVPEGTPGASVVGVKRVNELDYYSLGAKQLAEKVALTVNKLVAVVDHLKIRDDSDCYKEFRIGGTIHK